MATGEPPENTSLREHLRRPGVLALLLGAFSFVLYSGTLAFKFVYDYRQQVLNNALVGIHFIISALCRYFKV